MRGKKRVKTEDSKNYIIGIYVKKERFAFLEAEGESLFISKNDGMNAFTGDTVKAKIVGEGKKGQKREAKVIEIIARKSDKVNGVFHPKDGFAFIVNPKGTTPDIYVKKHNFKGAQGGDLVTVEIVDWGGDGRSVEGKIIEVIGNPNDSETMINAMLKRERVPVEFPPNAIKEAEAIAKRGIRPEDFEGRTDMRHIPITTWDSISTKDIDDAVLVQKVDDGYKLYVAIADCSFYVKPNTALEQEVINRATSVYMCNRTIHMMPNQLSQDLCSLNEGVDRLCMMFDMDLNEYGDVVNYSIYRAIIRSRHKMTYESINKMYKGDAVELSKFDEEIIESVFVAKELSEILTKNRRDRGALNFELDETRPILDSDKKVIYIKKLVRGISERCIESFMILTNEVVGAHLYYMGIPNIYRTHEPPSMDKLKVLNENLAKFNFRIHIDNSLHPKALQKVVEESAEHESSALIHKMILMSLRKANFTVDTPEHFGLANQFYSMSTSPIRRLGDLFTHRALVVSMGNYPSDKQIAKMESEYTDMAKQASKNEKRAIMLEEESTKIKLCEWAKGKIGEVYKAKVVGFNNKKVFLETDEYLVASYNISTLKHPYTFDDKAFKMVREYDSHEITLGQTIDVRIVSANMNLLEVCCEAIEKL